MSHKQDDVQRPSAGGSRGPDYAVESKPPAPRGMGWVPHVGWKTLVVGLVGLSLIAAVIAALNSPLLEIRNVNVRGSTNVSAEAVAQLTGLRGTNILLADLGTARERILDQPLIKDAAISRQWPNSIEVEIVERSPWVRWESDGTVWAVDREGVVLEGFDAPEESVLVRQVSSLPALRGGARVDLDAVDLISRLREAGPPRNGPEILNFDWSLRDGLTVITKHGRVLFGDSDGFEFKYAVWEELEFEAQRRGEPLLTADLRFGTRPSVEIGLGLGRATRIVEP